MIRRREENRVAKKKTEAIATQLEIIIDESAFFEHISAIIENRKARAGAYANREITLMFWEVGNYINSVELGGERAAYGKKILSTLSTKLSWSHICEIMRVKTEEGRLYYANDAATRNLGVKDLRNQISRKAFERQEIANAQLTEASTVPFNSFKDQFLLEVLDLKENYLEGDLEQAILDGLEKFILEYGHGLTYSGTQKVMVMDGEVYKLDLLFYSCELKRLIAIYLKLGNFKPQYKGQMEFYLKWLDRFERREGENAITFTSVGL
jgi:predicted nuclease of restriction endonuclease-like (RecB) superfamily